MKYNYDLLVIGDVTDRIQLAPMAIREVQAFADTVIGGRAWRVDYEPAPSAVFSPQSMAGVGMTESAARKTISAVKAGLTKADFDRTVALHRSMAEEMVLMR